MLVAIRQNRPLIAEMIPYRRMYAMKIYKIISIVMMPIYAASYGIAKIFNIAEDMPTIGEWLEEVPDHEA